MRKLTGKAKSDFKLWLKQQGYYLPSSNNLGTIIVYTNAIVTEWLDSVGIYIEIGGFNIATFPQYWYNIQEERTINGQNGSWFESRSVATNKAITKAVEIYNKRK